MVAVFPISPRRYPAMQMTAAQRRQFYLKRAQFTCTHTHTHTLVQRNVSYCGYVTIYDVCNCIYGIPTHIHIRNTGDGGGDFAGRLSRTSHHTHRTTYDTRARETNVRLRCVRVCVCARDARDPLCISTSGDRCCANQHIVARRRGAARRRTFVTIYTINRFDVMSYRVVYVEWLYDCFRSRASHFIINFTESLIRDVAKDGILHF